MGSSSAAIAHRQDSPLRDPGLGLISRREALATLSTELPDLDTPPPAAGDNGGPALDESAALERLAGGERKAGKRGADKATREALSDYPKRKCAHCGTSYKPLKKDQSFCTTAHRQAFHNLRALYGSRIFDLAVNWRRRRAKGSFTEFCTALDAILRDHKNDLGHAISDGAEGFGRMSPTSGVRAKS